MIKSRKHKFLFCLLCISIYLCIPSKMYAKITTETSSVYGTEQQNEFVVKGTVKDATGEPLTGVSISVKGESIGTVTNIDGEYSLKLSESGKTLNFSYVGFKPLSMKADKATLDVVMHEDTQMMDEVIVVGYGVQKKENLTGAVGSINMSKTMESRPVANIGQALQGSVPGLSISSISGELGEAPTIKLRGGNSSPNAQDKGQALILVDNVEIPDITMVNPDDIESISVLKDAGSAAIYGARGANGVILITTKSKKVNEATRISYSNNFSLKKPTTNPKQLAAWQQAQINLEGVGNANGDQSYIMVGDIKVDADAVQKMKQWQELYGGQDLGREMVLGRDFEFRDKGVFFYRDWDWYSMFVKDWTTQQQHNISINGGGAKLSYNVALGYLDQEGMTKINTDNFKRYNFSTSLVSKISDKVELRLNTMYVKNEKKTPYVYASNLYDYMYYLYRWQPIYPYGTYDGKEFRSAMTDLRQASIKKNNKDYLRIGGGITIRPIKNLTIDSDFYYTTTRNSEDSHGNRLYGYNTFGLGTSPQSLEESYGDYTNGQYMSVTATNRKWIGYTSNTVATYTMNLDNKHNIKMMGGTNFESAEYTYLTVTRRGLFDPNFPEMSLANGDFTTDTTHEEWGIAGFFGRINYDYKEKYLFEINGRYDGSSRFPKNNRFGYFGSYSAGYRITQEDFMQPLKPVLSDLKLRASYGEVGSQDVPLNSYLSTIAVTNNYTWMIDGNYVASFATPKMVRNRLTWEKVATYDIGLDARFLNNKVGLTFDWYRKYTKDVISAGTELPATLGGDTPKTNFGELVTPGWELAVDFNHTFENGIGLYLEAHISDYYTKVNKWSATVSNIPAYGSAGDGWYDVKYFREGMVLGDIWGYKTDGLFQESDFDANGKLLPGIPNHTSIYGDYNKEGADTKNLLLGYVKYKDLDGDESINTGENNTNDSGDKTVIGNIFPRYEYGFTIGLDYKGFDFKMFFQGVGKRHMWAAGNQVLPGFTSGEPYYKGADDYWRPDNPGAFYPRPYNYAQAQNRSYSVNDRYLLNMAYLRAKTLTLGYTLPKALVQKAMMNKVRVYFTAENLFEFDKMKPDIDPETGIRKSGTSQDARNYGRTYPYYRTLSFGLQVVF